MQANGTHGKRNDKTDFAVLVRGSASKLSQDALAQVLRGLDQFENKNLLVGSGTSDDAAIYRLSDELALVQTVDFFTPIVDDPYLYGQIAAANSLSDIFAMGGRPITAMNIVGMPVEVLSVEIINEILRGGADKVKEAQCSLVGGHSIKNPEPIYGLSVTGLVHPDRMMTNAFAKPGDVLVLTKPLGTGILTTGIKRGLVSSSLIEQPSTRCVFSIFPVRSWPSGDG